MSNSSMIFIIGFMGSGKSTLGKTLSHTLGFEFIDMDEWIANRACKTIPEIFAQDGDAAFRALEQECLHHLMHKENMVVATGGGTPCYFDNMELMLEIGEVVFLNLNEEVLINRLREEQTQRPLIADKSEADLRKTVNQLLQERLPFYKQASITINETVSLDELLQKLS
ncbi:MAG: shikimate kinase [Flavobacteriales bacterium]|jgi:shikimate kinase